MIFLSRARSFLRNLFRRGRVEQELDEELGAYVELRSRELEQDGMPVEEAHRAARAEMGGVERVKEEVRDTRTGIGLETLLRDLRYALRSLMRTPVFSGAALFTLALGVGASTAVVSVVNAVLLRPLDYRQPEQLVTILHNGTMPVAPANFLDWKRESRSFTEMAAAEYWAPNLTDTDQPERIWALTVTPNMFPLLGVAPLYGRVFTSDSEVAANVVVLSYRFWKRHLGGDPAAVGRTITLDGTPNVVIGVMPESFRFTPFWATRAELWSPLDLRTRTLSRDGQSLRIFARLAPGTTLAQARAEVEGITARLEAQYPGRDRDVRVTPLAENVVGDVRRPLEIVFGAVGCVLLIACANVAHMLLARAAARQREMAVRSALGASRGRLVRQLLTESAVLAFAGGVAGLALAALGVRALLALAPDGFPRLEGIALDRGAVFFALALTIATSVLFGLVPAMPARARGLADGLREGARGASGGAARARLRNALVASEFAMALVLLVGAGLLARTFDALQHIDPGWDPSGVATLVVAVGGSKEELAPKRTEFYQAVVREIAALPGVEGASAINHLPIAGDQWGVPFSVEGRPPATAGEELHATFRSVLPGYFHTMRLPLRAGRDFTDADRLDAPKVVIVSEELARTIWPGEDPIGKRIAIAGSPPGESQTVVGVSKNAVRLEWTAKPEPELYVPYLQNKLLMETRSSWTAYLTIVARTSGDPAQLVPAMRRAVAKIDPNVAITEAQTMPAVVALATARTRFDLLLLVAFAGVALTLAAVGIYGVISYGVSQRTRELGVRMALGAGQGEVLAMVLRQGMALALIGTGLGVAAALALSGSMRSLLYGVGATDPATFAAVCVVLLLVAALASYLPARRASRVDPATALRAE